MARMPSLFVSHGSPMIVLEDNRHRDFLAGLAADLPRPAAILTVTAHWETIEPRLNATADPGTEHDFGGFPAALYQLDYPAPGLPALAERAAGLLTGAGLAAATESRPKRDHGSWMPLLLAYPKAEIPVVELSVQPGRDARHHLAVGRALAPLRDDGVLILGSGSATHNLRDFFRPDPARPPGYEDQFAEWLAAVVQAGDRAAMAEWASAPFAARAHPSDDHFLPLIIAMGAGNDPGRRIHSGSDGALRMDSFRWD